MELNQEIRIALEEIKFAERFENLTNRYAYRDDSLEKHSKEVLLEILISLGYVASYNKKENFYKISDTKETFQFQLNICCRYGIVELIFDVLKNRKRLSIGGPWTLVYKLVTNGYKKVNGSTEYIGKKVLYPAFRNYDDFKNIMVEVFSIYEDFKAQLSETTR